MYVMNLSTKVDNFWVWASKLFAKLFILESAEHALFKLVRYVLLRHLRPELDGQDVEAGDSKIWVFGSHFI
jgi:hypothetical protein